MKITNKTRYDGRYLRKLFLECERREGTTGRRDVQIIEIKGQNVYGRASLYRPWVLMKLPKNHDVSARTVAQVYIHEVGHNQSLRHKEMMKWWKIDVSWWPDENVPLKTQKEKPKRDLVLERSKKALAQFEKWDKIYRRAIKKRGHYKQKVNYYHKKLAARQERKDEQSENSDEHSIESS